jgi:hypothetical protein
MADATEEEEEVIEETKVEAKLTKLGCSRLWSKVRREGGGREKREEG